jgi:hypothetical protein
VQEWFPDSKTLTALGWRVFSESREALKDLRTIIIESLVYHRTTGDLYDLQGTVEGLNPLQKIFTAAIPLFSSTNILIDSKHNVHFIDATTLIGIQLPLRTKIHRAIKVLGAAVSVVILDLAIWLKENTRSAYKTS